MEEAALKAALTALSADHRNPQRREDAIDCVTLVTNTLHRAGVSVQTVIVYIRDQIHESGADVVYNADELIQHAIAQYYR